MRVQHGTGEKTGRVVVAVVVVVVELGSAAGGGLPGTKWTVSWPARAVGLVVAWLLVRGCPVCCVGCTALYSISSVETRVRVVQRTSCSQGFQASNKS